MLPTRLERERQNEKYFASVSEIENISDDDDEVIQEDKNIRRGTHHIFILNKVEGAINDNLKCYCRVDAFIQYCGSLDDKFKEFPDLYSKFKKEKRNDKIKVNYRVSVLLQTLMSYDQVVMLMHRLQQLLQNVKI